MTELYMPPHGVLRLIREVLAAGEALHNTSVRVLGSLAAHDEQAQTAVLTHDNCQLLVDLRLSTLPACRVGTLVQCIGELRCLPGAPPQLVARVTRSCEGLDVQLYKQVLAVRREYEGQSSSPVAME